MNKVDVQEVYDKVRTPRTISAIETLGLKVTCCDVWEAPMWLYLGGNDVTVRDPNGQSDSLESMRDAIQAVIYSLQRCLW